MARVLDGKAVQRQILSEWQERADRLRQTRRPPGLAVVLAGDNPASQIYVRNKVKACGEMGIYSELHTPPATVTTAELLSLISSLNERAEIDGILVQMPLPEGVDHRSILLAVLPDKDVDGFHPLNTGNLVSNLPGPRPCTPAGIIELLRRSDIVLRGKRAVVVGRSDIVGKPMALLLLHENCTVTVCHSRTADLPSECRRADILVAAIGRPAFVRGDWIQPGATVIDVGINRLDEQQQAVVFGGDVRRSLIGDVHPVEVEQTAGAYTPVPGGVGPLTIAMLLVNTIQAAEFHLLEEKPAAGAR